MYRMATNEPIVNGDGFEDDAEVSTEINKIIGDNIRTLREEKSKKRVRAGEKKLTQEVLANELKAAGHDVGAGQIGHVEKGRKFPSYALLIALADYFDVSLDYLVGRTKSKSTVSKLEKDLRAGGFGGKLGEMYDDLSIERQDEVYRFVSALSLSQHHDNEALIRLRSIRNGLLELEIASRGEEGVDQLKAVLEERIQALTSGNKPIVTDVDDSNGAGETNDPVEEDS